MGAPQRNLSDWSEISLGSDVLFKAEGRLSGDLYEPHQKNYVELDFVNSVRTLYKF